MLPKFQILLLGIALLGIMPRGWTQSGTVVAWGDNRAGQATVPSGLTDVVGIAAGEWHNIALKADGTVVAWGYNASVPEDVRNIVKIGTGGYHNFAIKADGTLRVWGDNRAGQSTMPEGLSNVVDAKGGWMHSIALKSDGTVVAWGRNSEGQGSVPGGLNNVVAIAAGEYHNIALKSDGTVVSWGWNGYGQTSVPAGLNNVIAISGGGLHSLALKSDGTVVAWGWNKFGQVTVPAGLRDVVAIAGGIEHSLALKSDGTVVGWGANDGWASNDTSCQDINTSCPRKYTGQIDPPAGLSNVVAIAGGVFHSIALRSGNVTPPPPLSAPALSVASVDETSVTLSWGDLANETGYRLEARIGASGNWTEISAPGAGSTSYQHTGLTAGTTMFYRMRAFNSTGTSGYSAEVSATTTASPVPTTPALRLGNAAHNQVALEWDNASGETGYKLERKSDGSDWAVITSPGTDVTSFTDGGVTASTTYTYRIAAVNAAGASGYSAELNVTTPAPPLAPPATPSLQATVISQTEVRLQWADVANEVSYTIERKAAGADWAAVASPSADVTSFTDASVNASTSYSYRIAAINAAGSSGHSSEVNVTTPAAPLTPPATPSLQATAISQTEVRLTWTDVANETSYLVEWRLNVPGGRATVVNFGADATSFIESGLAAGKTYIFRIRAANNEGESAWSEATVTTPTDPAAVEASASFVRVDSQTAGRWPLEFGTDGTWIASHLSDLPEGVAATVVPDAPVVWAADSSEERALIGVEGTNRVAAGWSGAPLTVNLSIPRGTPRRIALYFVDWHRTGASQQVVIRDVATGTNLDSRSVEAFGDGKYLVYDIDGNVEVTVTSSEGEALLSGIFAGGGMPAPTTDTPLTLSALGSEPNGVRVRISGDAGQRFKVQRTTDFQTWTDVASSILLSTSTEMTLSGETDRGFFRTVNYR